MNAAASVKSDLLASDASSRLTIEVVGPDGLGVWRPDGQSSGDACRGSWIQSAGAVGRETAGQWMVDFNSSPEIQRDRPNKLRHVNHRS
jgi:hypothetical protein